MSELFQKKKNKKKIEFSKKMSLDSAPQVGRVPVVFPFREHKKKENVCPV